MYIKKMRVQNYKILKAEEIVFNTDVNIFAGANNAGKSTLLEALSIALSGKLNGYKISSQLKAGMFNCETRRKYCDSIDNEIQTIKAITPPKILIELYFDEDSDLAIYRGTNNSLQEDTAGISVCISFDENYADTYKMMLQNGEIKDIPIEFYQVKILDFSGHDIYYPRFLMKSIFIDTTRKDYSYAVDRFISDSISSYLTEEQRVELEREYRKGRNLFGQSEIIQSLNNEIGKNRKLGEENLEIDLKEGNLDDWMHQISIVFNRIPFENIGFGTQNMIKIRMALKQMISHAEVLLLEEPENNLSFTEMQRLVSQIQEKTKGKQIFLSTHSSYIVNKMNLRNLQLIAEGKVHSFKDLPADTQNYFMRLPGYDTLRVILASKVVLVEGPTDELIMQCAYRNKYERIPIEDGIDIFAIGGVSFKRYCDIGLLLNKKIIIVTDNDHDIQKNILEKYHDYLDKDNIKIFYEKNESLHTIEPSVLEVNCQENVPSEDFLKAINYHPRQSKGKSLKEITNNHMKENKSQWAMNVFESEKRIEYPTYIKDAIEEARK